MHESLTTGMRLGRYEIVASLGAGGMGEVYRARDHELGRAVAIKTLPAAFAENADRLRRFELEARAAAALNHPNILAVYDVGQHDGTPYLVCELLEGQSLRARLDGGALPLRKAVEFGIQIAEGLAAAHDKGIVHRDLKPENIFVTRDERLKILDFGLAKLMDVDLGTLTAPPQTSDGAVLGTVGYLSPEQASGQPADQRSDIFSLSVILFEMLTHRRAFSRATAAQTLAAVIEEDPTASVPAGPGTQARVMRVVKQCLDKAPERRFQSARDVALVLVSELAETDSAKSSATSSRSPRLKLVGTAALCLLAGAILARAIWISPSVSSSVARFLVERPPNAAAAESIAVSPDGRWLAFTSSPGATVMSSRGGIWIRALDEVVTTELPDTAGATSLFWSPDSTSLGFFAGGKVKRVAIGGGPASSLCDAPDFAKGGTWSANGVIVFATLAGIFQVPAAGGTAAPLMLPDRSRQLDYRWPAFLPDNRHFLYLARTVTEELGIYIGAIDDPTPRFVAPASSNAIYAAPGYLLFIRDRTLYAQPFNLGTLAVSGEPVPLAEGLDVGVAQGFLGAFSSSSTGVLAYGTVPPPNRQFAWYARDGTVLARLPITDYFDEFAMSPDGQRVAVRKIMPGNADLWIFDLEHNATQSRLTSNPEPEGSPVWSDDGQWVVYYSGRTRPVSLYRRRSTGVGDEQALLGESDAGPGPRIPTDWSRDGQRVLFSQVDQSGWALAGRDATKRDVWVLRLNANEPPEPVLHSRFNEDEARFSPDATWIAYVSDETGRREVYVQTFPPSDQRYKISSNGGTHPIWRQDGRELFYKSADGKLVSVSVSTAPRFEYRPSPVTVTLPPDATSYDVAPDGQRFLVLVPAPEPQVSSPFTVVLNWRDELKQRVPTR